MSTWALALRDRLRAVPFLAQDATVYLLSAIFAATTACTAEAADYRQWGAMSFGVYLAAGLACAAFWWRGRTVELTARVVAWVRRVCVLIVLVGAVLAPLSTQIIWRAENLPGAHAQPEVATIERAGDRVANDKGAYLRRPTSVGVSPRNDAKSVDETSFFPYLPGMAVFGLINAVRGPLELTDARVALAGFTLLVVAAALALAATSLARRGRAFQWLIVLPSGALPMVTGGDDLPVLALMLAALVAMTRRRPVLAGILMGLAGSLKFTAWPLLLFAVLVVRDREGRSARPRYAAAAAAVVIPAVVLGVAGGPSAFVTNVIAFPLGFSNIRSPAASPLLGQALTFLFPEARRLITVALAVFGVALCVAIYRWMRPRTPGAIARYCGIAMLIATVLAPATRFGYLIYPVNLFVWSYMLDAMPEPALATQSESSTSSKRTTKVLVGVGLSPASAALSEPLA